MAMHLLLFDAVQIENCSFVENLLLNGADVNIANDRTETPLHFAVRQNSTEIAEILIRHGADPTMVNNEGCSAFHFVIKYCDDSMINLFLRNGLTFQFNVPFRKKFFELALSRNSYKMMHFFLDHTNPLEEDCILHQLVKGGHIAFLELFLVKGFNANTANESGETLLHCAIQCEFEATAMLLLDYKADVNSKTVEGFSILHKAVIHNASTELVDRLLKNGATLNAKDNCDLTPLSCAVERKNLAHIRFFLDKNPDPHDKDNKLSFCLSFLNNDKLGEVSAIFVDRGFTLCVEDFNDVFVPNKLFPPVKDKYDNKEFRSRVQDSLKKTANNVEESDKLFLLYEVLRGSIKNGCIDIVNNLLTSSINVNIPFPDGYTMLHTAVINGHLPLVEKLLAFGADVNALEESTKMSALHFSVEPKREEIATFLLKNNANTEVRNEDNQTPLDLAVCENNYNVALLLLNAGASVKFENINRKDIVASRTNFNFLKTLLHFGALVDSRNFLELFCRSHKYSKYRIYSLNIVGIKLIFNFTKACSLDMKPVFESKDFDNLSSKFKRLLIKYIEFQGSSLDYDSSESKWYNFQRKCQEEIERMKLTKIEGFSISVDDILRRTPRQIAQYLYNEDFAQVLEKIDFKKEFPLYGSKIKAHLKKGEVTKPLLELSSTCLEDILNLNLPMLVKEKILSYLDNQELRRLIFTSPIDDVKKASLQYKGEDEVDADTEEDNDEDDYCSDYYDDYYDDSSSDSYYDYVDDCGYSS